jgi:N-acetyl-anhydromuramyl-L-alanine amidase AmpD
VHHSATAVGGARRFDSYHRNGNGWDELGYHFVIGNGTDTPDGCIEVGSRWHKQKHGAHTKTPDNYFNDHGIGICLVGDFTRARPTRKQMESLTRLTKFLSDQCRIAPTQVTTHHDVKRSTLCPGRYFDARSLRRTLASSPAATTFP